MPSEIAFLEVLLDGDELMLGPLGYGLVTLRAAVHLLIRHYVAADPGIFGLILMQLEPDNGLDLQEGWGGISQEYAKM